MRALTFFARWFGRASASRRAIFQYRAEGMQRFADALAQQQHVARLEFGDLRQRQLDCPEDDAHFHGHGARQRLHLRFGGLLLAGSVEAAWRGIRFDEQELPGAMPPGLRTELLTFAVSDEHLALREAIGPALCERPGRR